MAAPVCNITNGAFDCSNVFEGVDTSVTIIQALLSLAILVISVIGNLLLIAAITTYRHLLDSALFVSVSILISNTMVSIFLNGGAFLTAIARTWVFGFFGCKVFAFIVITGSFSRWNLVGLLSLDRFFRVYFPFIYVRNEKRVLLTLLVISWVTALLSTIIYTGIGLTGFDVVYPACSFSVNFSNLDTAQRIIFVLVILYTVLIGAVLPSSLYIAMYWKARSLRRVVPVIDVMNSVSNSDPAKIEAKKQSRRATITFLLLMITFMLFTSLIIIKVIAKSVLYGIPMSPTARIIIFFILSTIFRCFVIADFGVILGNRDVRSVFIKLMKVTYKNVHFSH